ncbi:ribosomal eL19 family protein [Methanocalculus sp. MC3]
MRLIPSIIIMLMLCISTAGAYSFQVVGSEMMSSSSPFGLVESGAYVDSELYRIPPVITPIQGPLTAGPPDNPGKSGSAPGQSGDAPGSSGNSGDSSANSGGNSGSSGNSGSAPGQSGDAPGNSGSSGNSDSAPGQSGDTPGNSDSAPGQSGDTPGNSDSAPGQSGDTPGNSGNAPGQSGDAPGNSGNAPGQSGDTPGNSGNAPGQSGSLPTVSRGGIGEVKPDPETGKSSSSTIIQSPEETAQLFIPQGTLVQINGQQVSQITIREVGSDTIPDVASDSTYRHAGEAVTCGPAGATFSEKVGVTFGPFSQQRWDALMEETGDDPSSLAVEWFNTETNDWERVDTSVNPEVRTVTAFTDHFTVFAMFIAPGAQSPIVTEIVTPIENNGNILSPADNVVEENDGEETFISNSIQDEQNSGKTVNPDNEEDKTEEYGILRTILNNLLKVYGLGDSQ